MKQGVRKWLLAGLILAGVCLALCGCSIQRSYEVVLPYDDVEGASWTYIQTNGDGKVECIGDTIVEDGYQEGRKKIRYQFKGVTPGAVELQFQYRIGESAEPVNAYAVTLNVAKNKKITEHFDNVYECAYGSFDGGGPDYWAEVSEEGIVHVASWHEYDQKNHEQLCGAGYSEIFRFSGRKPGKTLVTIFSEAFYDDGPVTADKFWLIVDENLGVSHESIPADSSND